MLYLILFCLVLFKWAHPICVCVWRWSCNLLHRSRCWCRCACRCIETECGPAMGVLIIFFHRSFVDYFCNSFINSYDYNNWTSRFIYYWRINFGFKFFPRFGNLLIINEVILLFLFLFILISNFRLGRYRKATTFL